MAFEIDNPIGTGTDQELLDFTRAAIARITMQGQMRTADGRVLTEANLPFLHKQVEWLELRIRTASGTPGQKTNFARRKRLA